MVVTTLASGSSGNCTLISAGDTHVLVDAGISCRRIAASLGEMGLSLNDLTGICITHEHSDHICGLTTLTKKHRIPIYTTGGTGRQLCYRIAFLEDLINQVVIGEDFRIGDMTVESFATLHDTAQPCGFALSDGEKKAAVVTDLGIVTDEVLDGIQGSDLLIVECNHDIEAVKSGPYPYYLKQRILSDHGHLSNEAGAALARTAAMDRAHTVILAHLSAENNTPAMARRAVETALNGWEGKLLVAPRCERGQSFQC